MTFKVILLSRDRTQQARSQNKFGTLVLGLPASPEAALKRSLKKDYATIRKRAKRHQAITLEFEDIINKPLEAARAIAACSDKKLDVEKMAAAVIPRRPECHPDLLETGMLPLL